ncbi:MAG: hypothetical protein LBF21_01875 [Puniceicoccales bacterium]|nr:hypothetical protein [Puniceicoccales bacterium]
MDRKYWLKGVLIFCVSSLSLWGGPGAENGESADLEHQDAVTLLKSATRYTLDLWEVSLWSRVEYALQVASHECETTDVPELVFSQKEWQCDLLLEDFSKIKTAIQDSLIEIDALIELAQAVKNEIQEGTNWSQAQASTREAYQALLDITRGLDEQRIERIARLRREGEREAECVLFIPPEDTE